jgi:hypothetical protein
VKGITHKITGVPSGGGIGRGLATVHAGLDGSRPVEQDLADSQRIKKIANITGFRFFGWKRKKRGRRPDLFHGGWEEGKKMNWGFSGRAKYQSYGGTGWYKDSLLRCVPGYLGLFLPRYIYDYMFIYIYI